jgi:hypothetical protein
MVDIIVVQFVGTKTDMWTHITWMYKIKIIYIHTSFTLNLSVNLNGISNDTLSWKQCIDQVVSKMCKACCAIWNIISLVSKIP